MPTELSFNLRENDLPERIIKRKSEAFPEDKLLKNFTFFESFVKFKTTNNTWLNTLYQFKIDTGAIISLAPDYIRKRLNVTQFFNETLYGVIRDKKCQVPVKITPIKIKLEDDYGKESPELTSWFAFSSLNTIPFLLGMKNILDKYDFSFKSSNKKFNISF